MKNFCMLLVMLLGQLSFADDIVYRNKIDLKADGIFTEGKTTISRNVSKKSCRAIGGVYLGRKACQISEATGTDKISVQKSPDSDTYKIKIEKQLADGQKCSFEGYGALRNPVQILAMDDQCELVVGYTSQSTLSAWAQKGCVCADGSQLKTSELRRTGMPN